MTILLIYALVLLLAVLISELAARSILSTAVLFLGVGLICGEGGLGFLHLQPTSPAVSQLADLALFSILFTDGMRSGLRELARAWRLPGRALLLGLPLTLLGTAAAAHVLAGLAWMPALLVGAVLCPTDPVFAAAIIGRNEIPLRLRNLLNVESGLNDGLALPLVVGLIAFLQAEPLHPVALGLEVVYGIALGVGIPWLAVSIKKLGFFSVHRSHESLFLVSIGVLVFASSALTHANSYLAAFAAGITLATLDSDLHHSFEPLAEPITEMLKLAAVLVFGALLTPALLADLSWWEILFCVVALVAIRPLALAIALYRSPLNWREILVAGWFGPKGFASVVYGLLCLKSSIPQANHLFNLVAFVVAGSIIAHSSTDVVIANWFGSRADLEESPSAKGKDE